MESAVTDLPRIVTNSADVQAVAEAQAEQVTQHMAELCHDAVDAIAAARGLPGQVATLILPADVSWGEGALPAPPPPRPAPAAADDATVAAITAAVRSGGDCALLLGGRALREPALLAAARIVAAQRSVRLLAEVFPTRMSRSCAMARISKPQSVRNTIHQRPPATAAETAMMTA